MNERRQQRLGKELETLEAEWYVRQEKLKRLRADFATEAGTKVSFQLEKEIEAEEKRLEKLTAGIEAIEQALESGSTISGGESIAPPLRSIDPQPKQPTPPRQAQPVPEQDSLKSEKGIDYTRLRDLLKAGKWKEADRETYEVMIRAVGKTSGDWFASDELLNFPCSDLKTIDSLWVKYSRGKFGFSVQKEIYVKCGAKLDGKYPGDKIWNEFCDRIGWRMMYLNLKFDLSLSSTGELPWLGMGWDWGWLAGRFGTWRGGVPPLAWRIVNCKINHQCSRSSS